MNDREINVNVSYIFYLGSQVNENAAMVAKKLLADDKITACFKQIYILGVICKVSNRKTLSGETFFFLEKNLLSIFKICASSDLLFFTSC